MSSERISAMTDAQAAFWRYLLRPFPPQCYGVKPGGGGKKLTWLKPRAIRIRLMEVCGPNGWRQEFRPGQNGMLCRLSILAPSAQEGRWEWVYQEDGGGSESMTGNDDDGSEKASYTNAFRRAAAAHGFGIELYQEGLPEWLADLFAGTTHTHQPHQANGHANGQDSQQKSINFDPPLGGSNKAPYAWCMKMRDHFGVDVLGRVTATCRQVGFPERTDQLSQEQLLHIYGVVCRWLRKLDNYNGEFDEWLNRHRLTSGDDEEEAAPARAPQRQVASNGNGNGVNKLGAIKKAIWEGAKAIIHKQTGREATNTEAITLIGELAASVPNSHGHRGEVIESLKNCDDQGWLRNILNAVKDQMHRVTENASAENDGIPY